MVQGAGFRVQGSGFRVQRSESCFFVIRVWRNQELEITWATWVGDCGSNPQHFPLNSSSLDSRPLNSKPFGVETLKVRG